MLATSTNLSMARNLTGWVDGVDCDAANKPDTTYICFSKNNLLKCRIKKIFEAYDCKSKEAN